MFDDRRQISFVWNKDPLSHVRPFPCSPWDSPSDFKLPQVKEIREVSINGQVHFDKSHLPNAVPALSHDIAELLPMKGPDASVTISKLGGAPDLQRALSLLSASSCGLPDPVQQASCLVQFTGAGQNSRGLPSAHGGSPPSASCAEGQPMAPSPQFVHFTMDGASSGYESTFFGVNRMN